MFFSLFFNLVGFMNGVCGVSYLYCKKFVEKSYDHCCSWLLFLKYRWYCFCFCSCCSTAYFPICLITSLLALFWILLIDILFTKHKSTKKVGWGRGGEEKGRKCVLETNWREILPLFKCSEWISLFSFFHFSFSDKLASISGTKIRSSSNDWTKKILQFLHPLSFNTIFFFRNLSFTINSSVMNVVLSVLPACFYAIFTVHRFINYKIPYV